jgi:adenine-specific DNA-methyltransferase
MAILDQVIENFSTNTLSQFFSQAITTFKTDDWDYDFLFDDNENIQESYSNIQKLGDADLQGGDDILVISAETSMPLTDRSGKKQQYEIAKKILKEEVKDAAFFIFYDAVGQFRLSFIRADFKGTKREFTTFKRYTYFVSYKQTNQTFIRQISACSFQDLDEIQKAFSVEPLNKEFYQKIAKAFYGLIGGKVTEGSKAKEYQASLKLPNLDPVKNHRTYQEFAVRFIGRTIFIWFLKNKTSDAGLPLIPAEWLTSTKVESTKCKSSK